MVLIYSIQFYVILCLRLFVLTISCVGSAQTSSQAALHPETACKIHEVSRQMSTVPVSVSHICRPLLLY